MSVQLDMFGVPPLDETLVGLAITTPEPCPRCPGNDALDRNERSVGIFPTQREAANASRVTGKRQCS